MCFYQSHISVSDPVWALVWLIALCKYSCLGLFQPNNGWLFLKWLTATSLLLRNPEAHWVFEVCLNAVLFNKVNCENTSISSYHQGLVTQSLSSRITILIVHVNNSGKGNSGQIQALQSTWRYIRPCRYTLNSEVQIKEGWEEDSFPIICLLNCIDLS